MRLFEFENLNNIDALAEFIRTQCSEYLHAYPKCFSEPMIRGVEMILKTPTVLPVNKNRTPVATPVQIHNIFVNAFRKAGFDANRDNSIFCTGNIAQAEMYANDDGIFAVFPIGKFNITWSNRVSDLFMDLEWLFEENVLAFDENKKFSNDRIEQRLFDIFKVSKDKEGLEMFSKLAAHGPISLKDTFDCSINPEEAKQFFYTTLCKEVMIEELAKLKVNVVDVSLVEFLKENYYKDNISEAVDSGFEIMVECDSYLAVPFSFLDKVKVKL